MWPFPSCTSTLKWALYNQSKSREAHFLLFFFFFKCWQENIADFGRWAWICFFFQAPIFVFCFDVLCLQLSNEQDVCSNCVCLQNILWSINKQGYFFILLINYFKQILLTYCIWWCILSSAFDAWYFSAKYSIHC